MATGLVIRKEVQMLSLGAVIAPTALIERRLTDQRRCAFIGARQFLTALLGSNLLRKRGTTESNQQAPEKAPNKTYGFDRLHLYPSHLLDPNRTLLIVWLLGTRIVGIKRHQIDEDIFVEERNKDHSFRDRISPSQLGLCDDLSAARLDTDLVSVLDSQGDRILGVDPNGSKGDGTGKLKDSPCN